MEPFIGQITMFGGNFAPRGWAFCDGQLLSIAQYQSLFALLGTTYGGDGRTTFALPDLRGRTPIHAGDGPGLTPRRLGARAGVETVALTANQIPGHTHQVEVPGTSDQANTDSPTDAQMATVTGGQGRGSSARAPYNQGGPTDASMMPFPTGSAGGNAPHENMPPFQAVNFIIALEGIFPSRS